MSAFESNNGMIDEEPNGYSGIAYVHPIFYCGLPTVEATEKALAKLDEDSALGPDLVPTRILKKCAKGLAPITQMLIIAILKFGEWLELWMLHWVAPLFKRKSVYDPANYGGIHLSSQICKFVENGYTSIRAATDVQRSVRTQSIRIYVPQRSARDAVAQLVLTLIIYVRQTVKQCSILFRRSGGF